MSWPARNKAWVAASPDTLQYAIPLFVADADYTKFAAHGGPRAECPWLARLSNGQGAGLAARSHTPRDDVDGPFQ
jgi:hypothetical protein